MKTSVTAATLSLCLLLATSTAFAAAGSLDTTFGSDGIVETNFGSNTNNFQFTDAALAPNGDIVVAGTVSNIVNDTGDNCVIVRYLPNGTLDSSFGTDGVVILSSTQFASLSGIIAVQSNGQILVLTVPEINGTFVEAMQRFNINGTPDATFGTGGVVPINVPVPPPYGGDISLILAQPDGKILLSGAAFPPFKSTLPQLTLLARYLSNGSLDTTFGTGGIVSKVAIGEPTTLAVLSGDGIMALNEVGQFAQFTSAGVLLSTPTGGTVTTVTESSQTQTSTFQPNGEYLVQNSVDGPFGRRNILATLTRFKVNGTVDSTFASPEISYGPNVPVVASGVSGIAVDSTGRVIIGGSFSSLSPATSEFGLARVEANGILDPTFGCGGTVTTQVGLLSGIGKVLLQSNGEIVAVGITHVTTGSTTEDLALARYLAQ